MRCPGITTHDVDPHEADDFYMIKGRQDRVCKLCRRRIQREYERRSDGRVQANKTLWKQRKTLAAYGLSYEQWEAMGVAQAGRCAICRRESALQVDHCHVSGVVRGLLCGQCNKALGLLKDDPDVLRAAIAYLEGTVAALPLDSAARL